MDKPYYASGDDLWFAGYVMNFKSSTLSKLSEILHVEIFNKEGQIVSKQKVKINEGIAHGVINLPDTLRADHYLIKGYTNWIRNFEDGLAFSHYFKITTATYEHSRPPNNKEVIFYPEGGKVLTNKLNVVAFTSQHLGTDKAFLINQNGDTLDKIQYNGSGYGTLRVIPESVNEEFSLQFMGDKDKYALPKAVESGSLIRLSEDSTNFKLILENTSDLNGKKFSILILSNGNIISAREGRFNSTGSLLVLEKKEVAFGLNHLIIVDEDGTIRNERVLYNNQNNQEPLVQIQAAKTFSPKDNVEFKIIQNHTGKSNISISIIPLKYFSESSQPTIEGDIEISEFSNQVELNKSLIAKTINDYSFEDILKSSEAVFDYPIEKKGQFHISLEYDSIKALNNANYSVALKRIDTIDFHFVRPSKTGRLSFVLPVFYGEKDLIIKPYDPLFEKETVGFRLNDQFSVKPFNKRFNQTAAEFSYAEFSKENQAMERFYGYSYKTRTPNPRSPITFSILRAPDKRIYLDDYIPLPDMITISKELLEGVRISLQNGSYKIQMRSVDEKTGYFEGFMAEEPLRIIDGIPVFDSKYIGELDPLQVKSISIKYNEFTLNEVDFDGVLAIETVEGNYGKLYDLGQEVFDFHGYSDNFKFEIPHSAAQTPDFRSTYYWNPNLILTSSEPTTISFPASDEAGLYKIVIQGITDKGEKISCFETFEILGK